MALPYLHRGMFKPRANGSATFMENIAELAHLFTNLNLLDGKSIGRLPASYLCYLCFKQGHYVKDYLWRSLNKPDGLDVSHHSKRHPRELGEK